MNKTLSYLRRTIGDIPIQQLEIFVVVAKNEGCSQTDLLKLCEGMTQASISRNCARLSRKLAPNVKGTIRNIGYDLIEARPSGEGRRETLHLTDNGATLYKDIKKILRSEVA